MFLPPVLRPVAATGPVDPAVQRIAEAPCTVLRGAPGSYVAEQLAGVISSWQRLGNSVWLRLADAQPGGLADSFAAACRHRWSATDDASLDDAAAPDPAAAVDGAPHGAVVVLELGGQWTADAGRLLRSIRPAATDRGVTVVIVAESRFWPMPVRGPDLVLPTTALLDRRAADDPSSTWGRLSQLAGRRAAVLHDVDAAAALWSADAVTEALAGACGLRSFLDRFTAVLVERLTPGQRGALEAAAATGYWHPQLGTSPVTAAQLRPWMAPLEQQWGWLRPVWAPSLRKELARPPRPAPAAGPGVTAGRPAAPPPARGRLEARLLGQFEVRVDGSAVARWRGQRGTSVLRYLLARPAHACTRDELLEEFWPDVDGAAARNRLQVAVSGLRRAFLDVTRLNVVQYADGRYRVNPELDVDVDVEAFERGLQAGAAAERGGDREGARTAYRRALTLYRGDFAADAPFEQWTLLPRESLRLQLVDALDRLNRIDLAARRFDDCIATAHRMLDLDPCREDAHRLLMRLYAAQGRPYLALRQYEFCRRVLRTTVDAGPAPETMSLYQAIRSSPAPQLRLS